MAPSKAIRRSETASSCRSAGPSSGPSSPRLSATRSLTSPGEIVDQLREVFEHRVRTGLEELASALEDRDRDLGRVVFAAAVDEVVGLVDDQHRVAQSVASRQGAEPDGRVEDVVVVAHHEVDLRQEVEADLERADHVLLCGWRRCGQGPGVRRHRAGS